MKTNSHTKDNPRGVIQVNGFRYAYITRRAASAARELPGDLDGVYTLKRRKGRPFAALFMDLDLEPFAFVVKDGGDGPVLAVTAHITSEGRVRYMYAMDSQTKGRMGMANLGYMSRNGRAKELLDLAVAGASQ